MKQRMPLSTLYLPAILFTYHRTAVVFPEKCQRIGRIATALRFIRQETTMKPLLCAAIIW